MSIVSPKISIITVVYNGEETIERTIQSVINQTYKNIEYIIIDGQSNDGTLEVIDKYRSYIDKVISEPDNGIYDAMNKGIEQASGDIIGIINSDDWYEPDTVEKIVEQFENSDFDLIYGNVWEIEEDGSRNKNKIYQLEDIWCGMIIPHPSVFIKTSIYQKWGYFDLSYKLSADFDLMLRLYVHGVKFGYINSVLANYRKGGRSSQNHELTIKEAIQISQKYLKYCPKQREVVESIKQRSNFIEFERCLREEPLLIKELLKEKFKNVDDGIIIFGAGRWGRKSFRLLEKLGLPVRFFVDSNIKKWNTDFLERKVKNPNCLYEAEGNMLIAVRDYTDEIVKQIEEMRLENINWITIDDLIEGVIRKQSVK